jgi:hypothetical protein
MCIDTAHFNNFIYVCDEIMRDYPRLFSFDYLFMVSFVKSQLSRVHKGSVIVRH